VKEGDNGSQPAYTRPATWEDVIATTELLSRYQVRFMLVGGYAMAAHGYVRMTEDIDIAVAPDDENTRRWIEALGHLPDGATMALQGEAELFADNDLLAIRINDEFTVDILPAVAGIPFAELESHIEMLELQGQNIPVLDLHGLLQTKQGRRPKDQADAEILQQAISRLADGS